MIFTTEAIQSGSIEPIAQELTPLSHDRARDMGSLQPTPALRKQVYLNTLAVYGVHYHLLYECDLWSEPEASDSTHPIYQILDGVAGIGLPRDLLIPKIGHVDCCALLPDQTTIDIPVETINDRAAYIAVQFDRDTLEVVELLGFFTPFDPNAPYAEVEVGDVEAGWHTMSELSKHLSKEQKFQDFKQSDDPLMQSLREIEGLPELDNLLAQFSHLARRSGSKDRMEEKFLGVLINQEQPAIRQFELKGSNSETGQPDLSVLAADLANKFAEILGME